MNGWHYKKIATEIAEALGVSEAELFPESLWEPRQNKYETEIDSEHLIAYQDGVTNLNMIEDDEPDYPDNIPAALLLLTPREEAIIRQRFGLDDGFPKTYRECGKHHGNITGTRIMQIEAKALRKLRHPKMRHILKKEG